MDPTPEQGQRRIETVGLNTDFDLFNQPDTRFAGDDDSQITMCSSEIFLQTGEFEDLPFSIEATPVRTGDDNATNPFHPEAGVYRTPFAEELKKEMSIRASGGSRLKNEPLELFVWSGWSKFVGAPSSQAFDLSTHSIKPYALEIIRRLRLQLLFPGGRIYEGAPEEEGLVESASIHFKHFNIVQQAQSGTPTEEESVLLHLPSEREKLQQIRGRFILVKKEGQEDIPEPFYNAFKGDE